MYLLSVSTRYHTYLTGSNNKIQGHDRRVATKPQFHIFVKNNFSYTNILEIIHIIVKDLQKIVSFLLNLKAFWNLNLAILHMKNCPYTMNYETSGTIFTQLFNQSQNCNEFHF